MVVTSRRPDHRVTLRRWHNDTLRAPIDLTPDVLSIQTAKSYGTAAGGWVLTCAALLDERTPVAPHDMVRIDLDAGDGRGLQAVMVGLVTRVARVVELDQQGQPRRVIRLTGLDLGKMLHTHNVGADLAMLDKYFGDEQTERLNLGLLFSGTPVQLVRSVLDKFFYAQIPWTSNWILADQLTTDDPWQTVDFSLLTLQSGSLWNVLKELANEPWNVLHTETGSDGKLHVILERQPFDSSGRLVRETFHEVRPEEAKSYDLGVDDSERTNWHFLKANLAIFRGDDDGLAYLMAKQGLLKYDAQSIERHGFRPSEHSTSYTPWANHRRLENAEPLLLGEFSNQVSGAAAPDFFPEQVSRGPVPTDIDLVRGRSETLFNWYRRNHAYLNGTLTVKGSPKYRAGEGLVFEGNQYLIERVTQNYEWGGTFSTSFDLTRGQPHAL